MQYKTFKRIYGTTQPKKIDDKLNMRDTGGNDLGYQGMYVTNATNGQEDYAPYCCAGTSLRQHHWN